jgi:hypothetical protein
MKKLKIHMNYIFGSLYWSIYYDYEMWEDSKKYNLKALEIVAKQNNLSAIADLHII